MPKKTVKTRVFPANGGLNTSAIPGTAPPSDLVYSDNIIFTINGSKKKKWGLNAYYNNGFDEGTLGNFRGMIDFWRNNAGVQERKFVCFVDGELYADSGNGVFSNVTGTTALTASDQVTFDVFVGLLIAGFESNGPQKWTQAGNFQDLGGTPPPCSLWRVHDGRLWGSGNKAAPHRLYYSAADNPEDWTLGGGAGSIDIEGGDSDPEGITAIFPSFYNELYVAKRKSIHKVKRYVSDDLSVIDFLVEPVIKGLGCVAHNSVVATQSDLIWASESGIHSFQTTQNYGNVQGTFLSYPIHDIYNDEVNFSKTKNMWGVYVPELNSYLLAYTKRGRSYNTEILGYNILLGKWFRWQNFDCSTLAQFIDSRGKTQLLVGTNTSVDGPPNIGILDKDIVTDFDVSYPCTFTTPIIFPAGAPDITFNFKNIFLYFKPQSGVDLTMSYKIDNRATITKTIDMSGSVGDIIGESTIGSAIIGGGGTIKKVVIPLLGEGSGIQLTFNQTPEDTDVGEDCDFYGFVLEAEFADDSSIPSTT